MSNVDIIVRLMLEDTLEREREITMKNRHLSERWFTHILCPPKADPLYF